MIPDPEKFCIRVGTPEFFSLEKTCFIRYDRPPCANPAPVGGGGAVRIISHKEIRHYRNAGVAIAAGSDWFKRARRRRRFPERKSSTADLKGSKNLSGSSPVSGQTTLNTPGSVVSFT
jgi:hypothetical protein